MGLAMRAFARRTIASIVAAVSFAMPLAAQNASIGGTVMMDPSEKPLANAEIVITSLNRATRSDSAGNFVLTGLPAGRYEFVVRLVGYESSKVEVRLNATQKFEADILLKPSTTKLETVDVKAASSPYASRLADFEDRRASKSGRYLTAEEFEKNDGRPVSAILTQQIPGLKAVPVNGRRFLASLRGGKLTACSGGAANTCSLTIEKVPAACYMQVVINGIVRYNGSPGQPFFDVDELDAKDIIGFEFYTTASTPVQYRATGGPNMGACGTVLFWTKAGG